MENDELIMKQKKCNLDNIVIEIYDVRNPNFGLTSATFNFVISVYNPNKYAIANPKLSYEAYINGIHVAVGKTMLPDIPSNDNRKYSTSFLLSYIDFGKSLINSIRSGDFELNMKGKIESKGISKRFDIFYKK
jgi:LEA14-like dessication related protein